MLKDKIRPILWPLLLCVPLGILGFCCKYVLVGYSFSTQVEEMLHQVEARYWGHSRKSILVAIKQAHTKWINWSSGHRSPLS